MTSVSTFELVETTVMSGGGGCTIRVLEFVIDGQPFPQLHQIPDKVSSIWLETKCPSDHNKHYSTEQLEKFRTGRLTWSEHNIQTLLLEYPAPLDGGRVPLSVCQSCGGLGCGAVSAWVTMTDCFVEWSYFGYERDFEPQDIYPLDGMAEDTLLRFDRAQYEAALRDALIRVRQLAAEIIESS